MALNHFLHVLRASLNLVIISITGSEFRKTFYLVLGIDKEEEGVRIRAGNVSNRSETNESVEMKSVRFDETVDSCNGESPLRI